MENLFDHAPTPAELVNLLGTDTITRAAHEDLRLTADTENGYIARLYILRGDAEKAEAFLGRIPEGGYRRELVFKDALH